MDVLKAWMNRHPDLTSWGVLAMGMLAILAWSARDVDLTVSQRVALAAATVLLAGLCAWIISWESGDDDDAGDDDQAGEDDQAGDDDAGSAGTAADSNPPDSPRNAPR